MTFHLYLLYVASIFLRFTNRVSVLGTLHFDLLLAGTILLMIGGSDEERESSWTGKTLLALCVVVVVGAFFAEWPGTVVRSGIPRFIKGIAFYFLTVKMIRTRDQLKAFLTVFLLCQTVRVIEPMYLHYTEGYWGGKTTMELDRLAGGPYDVINPNGLAYVAATVTIFLYYFSGSVSLRSRMLFFALILVSLQALILTGSRSGLVSMVFALGIIILRSRRRVFLLAGAIIGALVFISGLSEVQKDRYRSITDHDNERFGRSAGGRMKGVVQDMALALERPVFGFGLGTSTEANYHNIGKASPAHNLIAEVMQELGLVGLTVFLLFLHSTWANFSEVLKWRRKDPVPDKFMASFIDACLVWLWMNVVYSFASYGLSSWEWYLWGGLSVVTLNLVRVQVPKITQQEEGADEDSRPAAADSPERGDAKVADGTLATWRTPRSRESLAQTSQECPT